MVRYECLLSSVVLAFVLTFSGLAKADTVAPITSVVLFPGSASIERTASVAAGSSLLEISGLPNNFDTKTLLIQADHGIRIGQIVVQEASKQDGAHPREKELQKKIRDLKDQLDTQDIDIKSAGLVTSYLDRVNGGEKGSADGKSVTSIADSIENTAARAYQRAQRAEIRKRLIKEELDRVEFELSQIQSGAKNSRSVSVQAVSDEAGQVRLSYQVSRAGWQPAYRATLDSTKGTLNLERLAQVSQKTGEDWVGVKLRLSTGQPQAFRDPVDPQTRRLIYYKPQPKSDGRSGVANFAAAPAPMVSAKISREQIEEDAYVAPVIETQGAFATEFEVPGKANLPADGREVAVTLGQLSPAIVQRVQVTPGVNKIGVLIAEFDRPAGVWLPGNIQLYRDGSYIGATRWAPDANERFSLGFGQDDLLRVAVERKNQFAGSSGFVGQRAQKKVADTFVLSNLHKSAIDVLVLESAPVSQSEEIEVERIYQPLPNEVDWKGRPGVVAWKKQLAPNETWKIDVGYSITYPKEGTVGGLP